MSFSKINNQTVSKTLSHEKRLFDFIFRQIKDLIDAHAQNCPTVVSESQVDCLIYIRKSDAFDAVVSRYVFLFPRATGHLFAYVE